MSFVIVNETICEYIRRNW